MLYHYDPAFIELFAHTSDLLKQVFRTEVRRRHHAGRGDPRAGSGRGQSDLPGRQGAQSRVRRLRQMVRGFHRTDSAAKRSNWRSPTTTRSIRKRCARPATPIPASNFSRWSIPKRRPARTTRSKRSAHRHEFGVLTMVDTVSGLGGGAAQPGRMGTWTSLIAGPQKCLGGTPGLSLMSVSPAAWEAMESASEPVAGEFPLDSRLERSWIENRRFPTPRRSARCTRSNRCWRKPWKIGMERVVWRHQTDRPRLPGRR